MPASPRPSREGLLRLSIRSAGKALGDDVQLPSVQVRRGVSTVPSARLEVSDGDAGAEGGWPVSDGPAFVPGAEITISAGYGDQAHALFEGIVVKVGVRVGGANDCRLVVDCRDKAVRMTVGRRNANHVDQTDGEVIRGIARAHGLQPDVADTGTTHQALVQYACTDWDFVVARAEVNGLLVIARDGTLSVKAPDVAATPVLGVSHGVDLLEFQADVDARGQAAAAQAVAWDPGRQAVAVGDAAPPEALTAQGDLTGAALAKVLGVEQVTLQTTTRLDAATLTAWGRAQQIKSGLARVRGRMKRQGSERVQPGTVIELDGMGRRSDGRVFVSGLSHDLSRGQWTTEVEFGASPEWLCERTGVVAPPATGWLPAVGGLQIGVVFKADGDPAGQGRVQVQLPVLRASTPGVWARLAQLHASRGFGACFVPEVGDEVAIGFFNDDPSSPVVLGSLYGSRRASPYDLTPGNDVKAIVARCRAMIEFDEKDAVVTVTTPAHDRIVLSDKDRSLVLRDQDENLVELKPGGITLDSPKDIALRASGRITIDAVGPIDLRSQVDVASQGLDVTCRARAGFTAQGGASAELSAAGRTVVKGAVVLIN